MPLRTAPTRVVPVIGALAAGLVLTGCGPAGPPSTTPSTAVAPTPAAAPLTTAAATADPATAIDGTDYAACRDGRCTVEVRAGTSITFDPSLRISSLRVESIDGDQLSLASTLPSGGSGNTSTGPGGSGQINGLAYRVLDVRDGTAVLEFTPG